MLVDRIKKHEGYSSTVYKDSVGVDTIGYGFNVKYLKLDRDICDIILREKILDIREKLYKEFPWYIYQHPQAKEVIIEMVYQLGMGGFSKFKDTIRHLRLREYKKASSELLSSLWATQTPKRAKELSEILEKL